MFNIMTNSLLPSLLLVSLVVFSSSQKYGLSAPSSICIDESLCNCTLVGSKRYEISCNFSTRDYTIDANSLPPESYNVEIVEGGNVVFEARSFSKLPFLARVSVRRVKSLVLKRESFVNLLVNHLWVEISDAASVEMESKSFYLLKGPVSYNVIRCARLTIHSDAVPWIQTLTVSQVARVELHENSLSQTSEKIVHYHQGFTTKITMHNVSMDELPKNSFPSSAAEVRLSECRIKLARKNCFSAIELYAVHILNSSFDVIETEAFSERSLLRILHFSNVSISQMQAGAILSAVTNFTIFNSNINTIESAGFNMSTTVSVHFANNVFRRVKDNGITLRSWTKATLENNTLRDLDEGAINLPSWDEVSDTDSTTKGSIRRFHFIGNILERLKPHSLKLYLPDQTADILIKETIFILPCHCEWRAFFDTYIQTNSNAIIESMYNSSYCAVNPVTAKCFQHHANFMLMASFSEHVCHSQDTIRCLEEASPADSTENANINKAVQILNEDPQNQATERTLVSMVAAVAAVGVMVVIILSIVYTWLSSGKGKFHLNLSCVTNALLSLYSRLTTISSSGNMGRATSANSITRVSVHEYAEVGPQKLFDMADAEDRIYICEDKATQTLPEELTQELLQVLREKLDDPQDYTEARHMIEHLYDLIKVEECCNNNTLEDDQQLDFSGGDENDLVYDVITPSGIGTGPRVRRYDKSIKKLANKGTRAPSPDKLSPRTFTKPLAPIPQSSLYSLRRQTEQQLCVDDYAEPSDRRESDIYCELVDIGCRDPSSHQPQPVIENEYAEPRDFIIPIYSELDGDVVGQPLPQ